jgi:pimeloyl-ACP methyl ester carboxylesterase
LPEQLRFASAGSSLSASVWGTGNQVSLFFYPLAEERKGCARKFAETAAQLTRRGWTAVVFDYFGTGDSPGDFPALDSAILRDNIDQAVAFSLSLAKTGGLVLLGARTGGWLALDAAARHGEKIAGAVLWEPVFDGGKWLKDLFRRSKFRNCGAAFNPRDADGYLFGEELLAAVSSWREPEEKLPCPVAWLTAGRASAQAEKTAKVIGASLIQTSAQPFWLESDPRTEEELIELTCNELSSFFGLAREKSG